MDGIEISVWRGGYPVHVTISKRGNRIDISHTELLSLEQAVTEAKRQVLCQLDRKYWHEVDPALAGK